MIIFYSLILLGLSVYSYALIDPNITFFQHPVWVTFRDAMVQLGYHQRATSWNIYLVLVVLLFAAHLYFVKSFQKFNPVRLAIIVGGILLLSYPFLSHDFFNYLFDAKIFTYYHENPYLKKALDFPQDEWLRFMHWTHRTYPYGPVFLVLTIIPSFLAFGKFVLNFLFFKAIFVGFYIAMVYAINKLDKKWAIILATHPLILIEGVIVSHNDLIGLSLALIGISLLWEKRQVLSRVMFIVSAGIKYINAPVLLLTKGKYEVLNYVALLGQICLLAFLISRMGMQPWYFLCLFAFVPFFSKLIQHLNILFFGLLMSYYPYIMLGGWDSEEKVALKNTIIGWFFIANMVYLLVIWVREWKLAKKKP